MTVSRLKCKKLYWGTVDSRKKNSAKINQSKVHLSWDWILRSSKFSSLTTSNRTKFKSFESLTMTESFIRLLLALLLLYVLAFAWSTLSERHLMKIATKVWLGNPFELSDVCDNWITISLEFAMIYLDAFSNWDRYRSLSYS